MKLASKGSSRLPRRLRRLGIALALSATALGAQAAGLGRLNLLSALGQPLRAEIELTSVGGEAGTLTARLANADAFSQAGIEFGPALSSLRFSIQKRANGQQYVLVTSSQQVNEPFLDLLVELTWGSGRLVREYTVLLDPPETRQPQLPAPAPVQPQTSAAPTVVRRAPPPAPAADAPAPTAALPPPAPAPARPAPVAPAPTAASGSYVVQSGDTAMSIARSNKPEDVSLEKVLAALYRDNQQAFFGNIDRLKAGATLKIPDASTAQAIDGGEARRIVASTSNFSGYRDKLASNAAAVPAARAPGQQASGRLSTQVEDRAAPTETNDRLQLSRPDATKAATAAGAARTGAGGPTADDLAAKDRELQETRSRLALLEKNVSDLQELLKLKNQTLSDLQKAAATKTAEPPAPSPAPAVVATPPAPVVAAPTPAPVAAAPTPPVVTPPAPAPAAVAPATAPAPAPAPAPAAVAPPETETVKPAALPPSTTSGEPWYDALLNNSLLLVGILLIVLLLLGYGVYASRRRRIANFEDSIFVDNSVLHANSVFGTTGGQSVDTANTGFHSNFVPVAGTLPEHNEVDPVAEADVYIAYGRDAQAEEILKEALRADENRQTVRLKLLEIYARRGDAKTFESMATELYAATGGQGDEWRQAAALGIGIDPRNPLYVEPVAAAEPEPAPPPPAKPAPAPSSSQFGGAGSSLNFGMSSLGLNTATAAPDGRPTMTQTAIENAMAKTALEHARTEALPSSMPASPTPSMDLDFDLGNGGGGFVAPLRAATPAPTPTAHPASDEGADMTASASGTPLIDPFTASAFGASPDSAARTAVNLPAFRARAEPTPPQPISRDADGFTASDIFGSSIIADDATMYGQSLSEPEPVSVPERMATRRTDDRDHLANRQFDKTEPLEAFSGVNLDLDPGDFAGGDGSSTDFGAKTDVWQAMATKLDLALAYSDIGDKDGARELLEEVVRNGDQVQSDRARQLISDLG